MLKHGFEQHPSVWSAIHSFAHRHTMKALAERLGKKAAPWCNKWRATAPGQLTLVDVLESADSTLDYSILHALGEVANQAQRSDRDLVAQLVDVGIRSGELSASVMEAMADGRISLRERDQILSYITRCQLELTRMANQIVAMAGVEEVA